MKCADCQLLFSGWITDQLNYAEMRQVELHVANCPRCTEELLSMKKDWELLGSLKTLPPSDAVKDNFYLMLGNYKETADRKKSFWNGINSRINNLWNLQPRLSFAYSFIIVIACMVLSYLLIRKDITGKQSEQVQALTSQVHELRETMMLALLENPSASERIKAVSYTSEIKNADKQVVDALLTTLNNDPNVNVRLCTLDALTRFADHPEVRQALIESISKQDSPLMQSAIADIMVKLQEKRSVHYFKDLLHQKNLDEHVRSKIKTTINHLI